MRKKNISIAKARIRVRSMDLRKKSRASRSSAFTKEKSSSMIRKNFGDVLKTLARE